MPRDWTDVFITGDGAPVAVSAAAQDEPERRGFFRRLRDNLSKNGILLDSVSLTRLDQSAWRSSSASIPAITSGWADR